MDISAAFHLQIMRKASRRYRLQPAAGYLPIPQMAEQKPCHIVDGIIAFRFRRLMGFPHKARALGINEVLQRQRCDIRQLFIRFNIRNAALHQIRMYHANSHFKPCLICANHHQLTAARQLQRAVCRLVPLCHTANRRTQGFHRADVYRNILHNDIGHVFLKAGHQRTKRIPIVHSLIIEIHHPIGPQGQRRNDIFQRILII